MLIIQLCWRLLSYDFEIFSNNVVGCTGVKEEKQMKGVAWDWEWTNMGA